MAAKRRTVKWEFEFEISSGLSDREIKKCLMGFLDQIQDEPELIWPNEKDEDREDWELKKLEYSFEFIDIAKK